MKTPFIKLAANNATLDYSNREGFSIKRPSGKILGVLKYSPDPAAFTSDVPGEVPTSSRLAQHALNTLLELDVQVERASKDLRWSDAGRRENLMQGRLSAIKTLIAVDNELIAHEKTLQAQEAQLYGVPQLRPDDIAGFMRDREIRDVLRHDMDESSVIGLLSGNATKGVLPDPALMLAVLRSPIKKAQLEKVANELWRNRCESLDPVLTETIKIIAAAIVWSRSMLDLVVGICKRELLGYTQQELFEIVHPLGGAALFGFSTHEVVRYTRALQPRLNS